MSLDATAEALVAETAAPIEAEMSEDEAMDAAFDRMQAEPEEPEAPKPEAEPEVEAETEAPPSIVPGAVKDHWGSIPKEARDAILTSHQEMTAKLANGQRLVHGLTPIKDAMVRAAQEMPHLADMKPEVIASEMMALAKISRDFNEKPVETIMGLIQKHNLTEAMQKHFTGQEVTSQDRQVPELMKTISNLQAKLDRLADPEYMRSQFTAISAQERATESVSRFAETAEHWSELEPHIPAIIPIVRGKLGESASAEDVLSEAYRVARDIYLPETKTPVEASVEDAGADSKRTEAALKAKSVNVAGKPTGKGRDLSEDELLDQAWERMRAK